MAIKLGTATPSAYKLGSASVSKVYLGASQVWPVASAYTPTAVLLTSGTSYTVPSGATSMKAWAVGSSSAASNGNAGGCAYKTWSVSGGSAVAYVVAAKPVSGANGYAGYSSTVTYGGVTITGGGGTYSPSAGGTYSGGDGGANGGKPTGDNGGAVGGTGSTASCGRTRATDVSGLLAAVALAGGKATEDCGASAAFGSGGADKYNYQKGPGYGGGCGYSAGSNHIGGAVVLYFT